MFQKPIKYLYQVMLKQMGGNKKFEPDEVDSLKYLRKPFQQSPLYL